jgi:tRNA pseudouridine55 synthase
MNVQSVQFKADEAPRPKRPLFLEDGILVVDKPDGMTSMDVIRELRRVVSAKRIGHGGTLDPFATGVLPILFNGATRLSERIMAGMKEYEGTLQLGVAYDTQDLTGKPVQDAKPIPLSLDLASVQQAAQRFVGRILQRPPQFSAIKRGGRPLYEYARQGQTVEIEPREVLVEAFDIIERLDERRFRFRVRSGKGVYVRTLVHDLGQDLSLGGVTETLRRTQTGPFGIDQAVQLSTLRFLSDIKLHLKPINAVLLQG